MSAIACTIGRSPSTVTSELKANGGPEAYRVWPAHMRARNRTRRPNPAKLDQGPLCDKVTKWLKELWSPEEIANRLRQDFPDDPVTHVSHETIYQCLSTSQDAVNHAENWRGVWLETITARWSPKKQCARP